MHIKELLTHETIKKHKFFRVVGLASLCKIALESLTIVLLIPITLGFFHGKFDSLNIPLLSQYSPKTIFIALCAFLVASIITKNIILYFAEKKKVLITKKITYDLNKEVFNYYVNLGMPLYDKVNSSERIHAFTIYPQRIVSVLENITSLFELLLKTIIFIGIFAFFFKSLIIPCIIIVTIIITIATIIGNKIVKRAKKEIDLSIGFPKAIQSFVMKFPLTLLRSKEKKEIKKVLLDSEELLIQNEKFRNQLMIFNLWLEIILILSAVTFVIILFLLNTSLTTNIMSIVIMNTILIQIPPITFELIRLKKATEFLKSIENKIADLTPQKNGTIKLKEFNTITFENVSFAYEKKNVLTDISFSIAKNEHIAIVGDSGSGKSTIAKLITRFYDVKSGEICINGKNITQYDIHSVRPYFGVVTAEPILFEDSFLANITYNEKFSAQDIAEVLKICQLDSLVENLPQKKNTIIKESGKNFSSGEKQRISLARVILQNTPVLIFDEPTSAIDSILEKNILENLKEVLKHKTVITIAHRLHTIIHADVIYVMKGGKIIESGTAKDLLEKESYFKKMWDAQQSHQL